MIDKSAHEAAELARELVKVQRTDAIVTPVYIEFIAGAGSSHELSLAKAYLSVFRCLDEGRIPKEDWDAALRRAKRVPRDGKPRDVVDCLIRAIADRLKYDVTTTDATFQDDALVAPSVINRAGSACTAWNVPLPRPCSTPTATTSSTCRPMPCLSV